MDELRELVFAHKYSPNRMRTNIVPKEERLILGRNGHRFAFPGPLSNGLKEGPIVDLCKKLLGAQINSVQLNKDCVCSPHRDKGNGGPSWICYWGDYTSGGDLNFEDGTVYSGMEKTNFTGRLTAKL